jgi:hypothetical protein
MTNLNVSEILAENTVVNPDELVLRPVTWFVKDPATGKEVEKTADVFIVANLTFAAHERIYLGDSRFPESTRQGRAISERVRFGKKGNQTLTYEQASALNPRFGYALATAIYALDDERNPKPAPDETKEDSDGDEEGGREDAKDSSQ